MDGKDGKDGRGEGGNHFSCVSQAHWPTAAHLCAHDRDLVLVAAPGTLCPQPDYGRPEHFLRARIDGGHLARTIGRPGVATGRAREGEGGRESR